MAFRPSLQRQLAVDLDVMLDAERSKDRRAVFAEQELESQMRVTRKLRRGLRLDIGAGHESDAVVGPPHAESAKKTHASRAQLMAARASTERSSDQRRDSSPSGARGV
jgi:hypothetical protein